MSGPALHDEVRDDSAASRRRTAPHLLVVLADGLLDVAVVLLASWTVVYHASLLLGLRSTPALLVEAAVLLLGAAAWVAVTGSRPRPSPDLTRPHPAGASLRWDRTVLVTVVAAAVGALAMALDVPWVLVWPAWLVAGVAGTACALTRLRVSGPEPGPVPGPSALESWIVIVCTLGLAAFSMVILRPNPDDLFYVNWSQWVAAHGEFPLRDTLYSDLGYPLANWPPVASYDGLVGAVAHLLGTSAGNVVYIVVPPVATGLAVLALWRLLRAWGVEHRVVALLAALAFLLVDGTESYASPGNLFATRLWQGKVILACVLVPVLLVHLLRQTERPSRSGLGFLFLCGAAAVALSTTAIFLVPVVAAAGAAPLVRTSRRAALAAFAAAAAYPVGAGIVTLALGGRSADDFGIRRQYRFDPSWFGHQVFLTGPMALLAVGAVLLGALLVPHPAARLTTGVAVVLVGLTFVPGFTRLTYDVVGLGPTLWRLTWACTVAALVGAGASWVAGRLRRSRRTAVAAGLAGVLLLAGVRLPDLGRGHDHDLRQPATLAARPVVPRGRGLAGPAGDPAGHRARARRALDDRRGHPDRREGGGAPGLLPRLPERQPRLPLRGTAPPVPVRQRGPHGGDRGGGPRAGPARRQGGLSLPPRPRRGARAARCRIPSGFPVRDLPLLPPLRRSGRDQGPVTGMFPCCSGTRWVMDDGTPRAWGLRDLGRGS